MYEANFRHLSLISNRTIFDLLLPIDRLKNIDLTISSPESLRDGTRIGRSTAISRHFVYFFISIWKKKLKAMISYSNFFTPLTALFFIISKVFVASEVWSTGIKRQDGVKLTNRLLESVHGVGFIMCIRECQTRGDCFSVSYSRARLICDLHRSSVRKENDASLMSGDPLFTYVDMADVASVRF